MAQKTFSIPPDRAKYFADTDNSILKFSVDHGRAVLQAESLKDTLATLYQSRQKQMIDALVALSLDPALVSAAKLGPDGTLIVELQDGPAPAGPPA